MLPNGNHITFRTKDRNKIEVLYDAALSDNAKFQTWQLVRVSGGNLVLPKVDFNCCYWESHVRERAYVRVHENRIEVNAPSHKGCLRGCMFSDVVEVKYFDRIGAPFKRETMCTPYHLFGFLECWGQVAATAPHPWLNNFFCWCLRDYVIGLDNADEFSKAMSVAYTDFKMRDQSELSTLTEAPSSQNMQSKEGVSIKEAVEVEKYAKEEKEKKLKEKFGTNYSISIAGKKIF